MLFRSDFIELVDIMYQNPDASISELLAQQGGGAGGAAEGAGGGAAGGSAGADAYAEFTL